MPGDQMWGVVWWVAANGPPWGCTPLFASVHYVKQVFLC